MSKIAVIIVNYNASKLALAGVRSVLERDPDGHDVHIHLIDNASPVQDATHLETAIAQNGWQRDVTLYAEQTNHGFGRGNNIVLNALSAVDTPPEFVFLLNPDAQIKPQTLGVLVRFMTTHPQAAMLGTRAYNPGQSDPVAAAFRFPSMLSTFSAALNFGPVSRLLGRYQVSLGGNLETCKVDWVSGAAVLARREIWEKLGFFDPAYFLYYEEVDLMRRTRQAGWECWHVAEAEIIHVEGASTEVRGAHKGPGRKPPYWYHSWQYYFLKNHGRLYALCVAISWIKGAALNHVLARVRGQTPAAPQFFFRDFWAFAVRPLLGLRPKSPD